MVSVRWKKKRCEKLNWSRFFFPFFGEDKSHSQCGCGWPRRWLNHSQCGCDLGGDGGQVVDGVYMWVTLISLQTTSRVTWTELWMKYKDLHHGVDYRLVQNTCTHHFGGPTGSRLGISCKFGHKCDTCVRENLFKCNHQRSLLFVLSNWEWVDCLDKVLEVKKHVGKNPSVFALLDVYSRDCISTTTRRGRRTGRQFRTDVQIIWQSRGGGVKTRLCRGSN